MAFSFFPFHFISKFPPRWAWLGGYPGVWMQSHVRSILAPGTAPGRMACRFPREHGKNRFLPAEKERPRKLGVQGGYPPWRGPGAGPGWRVWEGRLASLPWLSGNSFSTERVPLGVWGTECPHITGGPGAARPRERRRSRLPPSLAEDYRFPPARVSGQKRQAARKAAREWWRSRPPPPSAEGYRFSPARASLCKEARRPPRKKGGRRAALGSLG